MDAQALRESATDAIGYWEPRRLVYNVALASIVLVHFGIDYPASKTALSVDFALSLFLLAVLANVAYCAVYLVDIFAQASAYREQWRKYRWAVFIIGMLFAGVITHFFARGMFEWLCGSRSWLGPFWGSTATTRTPRLRATFFPLVQSVALALLDLVPVTKLRE